MTGAARAAAFFRAGWTTFEADPGLAPWVAAARPAAEAILADPARLAADLRCGGTWFAGVHAFGNDAAGAIAAEGVPALAGEAVEFIAGALGLAGFDWDQAQISACYPGYPQQGAEESAANFRYRLTRDAAHVDGLLRDSQRRRRLGETHGFILGIPLTPTDREAAPLVVWEGSHEVMRAAFRARLAGLPPSVWGEEDITKAYHAARAEAFDTCPRRVVHVSPGGAYVVHRLALHGVAPWQSAATAPRVIAYFRPDPFPGAAPGWWLDRA